MNTQGNPSVDSAASATAAAAAANLAADRDAAALWPKQEPDGQPGGLGTGLGGVRRKLVVHDSLAFLALLGVTVVLFGITLALFRSFERHRDHLSRQWAAEGRTALARGDARSAVTALRAALSYTPGYAADERGYQMLLAEALAGSGHQEEATSYFLTLWTTRPGDGFVNLQLAHLARTRGDSDQAIEYYRAAIFGDWGGDGQVRRRECRLELADYLIERHDLPAARAELLIATGNNVGNTPVQLEIGERLAAAGDLQAALGVLRRAIEAAPGDRAAPAASIRAGAAAFALSDYKLAEDLLGRGSRSEARTPSTLSAPELAAADRLARDAARLRELALSRSLPAGMRGRHLETAAAIAQARLQNCAAVLPAAAPELNARWKAARDLRRRALAGNGDAQDALADLIFTTEVATANPPAGIMPPPAAGPCGPPSGDSLLLLLLARVEAHTTFSPLPALAALDALATGLAAGDTAALPGPLALLAASEARP